VTLRGTSEIPRRWDGRACLVCARLYGKDGLPCKRHGGPPRSTSASGRRARRLDSPPKA